jgi:hypothetical protein
LKPTRLQGLRQLWPIGACFQDPDREDAGP